MVAPSSDIAERGWTMGDWWAGEMRAGLGMWMDGHEYLKDKLKLLIKTEVFLLVCWWLYFSMIVLTTATTFTNGLKKEKR